jgi:hypothetical protein
MSNIYPAKTSDAQFLEQQRQTKLALANEELDTALVFLDRARVRANEALANRAILGGPARTGWYEVTLVPDPVAPEPEREPRQQFPKIARREP